MQKERRTWYHSDKEHSGQGHKGSDGSEFHCNEYAQIKTIDGIAMNDNGASPELDPEVLQHLAKVK